MRTAKFTLLADRHFYPFIGSNGILFHQKTDSWSLIKKFVFIPLFFIIFYAETVYSANITYIQAISFGTIVASPDGDVIEIEGRFGPSQPYVLTGGNSHLAGDGFSGMIRVLSDIAGQSINLIFPASILLKTVPPTDTMTLDSMSIRSKTSAISTAAGEEIDFDIGGRLYIISGQKGDVYSETMTVTVNIFNP